MNNFTEIAELAKVYQRLGPDVPSGLHNKIFKRIELLLADVRVKQACLKDNIPSNAVHSYLHDISVALQRLQHAPYKSNVIASLHQIINFIVVGNEFMVEDVDMLSCVYQRVWNSDYDYQFLLNKIEFIL